MLRMEGETLNLLQKWADEELRSLNGQIEYILRDALRKSGRMRRPEKENEKPGE
ncbi:conserved hypothetical protein [Candidatus Zixiibacteriota bacterium]|nr:conserved hypothetical protein [candidate division Zixibacteria bacterium]